jgi:hypothetical protein
MAKSKPLPPENEQGGDYNFAPPTAQLVRIHAAVGVAALTYATQLGIPIFPCGRNKAPLTKKGFKDATTDPEQILEWWEKYPDAMIGMPTAKHLASTF